MAKKQATRGTVEITPAQLAKALEGVAQSINAIRRLVLKLPPDATITVKGGGTESPSAHLWDFDCPPPE